MSEDVVRVELTDIARTELAQRAELVLPPLIVDAGPVAVEKFLEFFAARIANRRTRAAYGRAVGQFLAWCEARDLVLQAVSPLHLAAYIRTHHGSAPTVKQHLAAIRMLGDWLVVSQVLPVNPAAAVRGPKHVVTKGATPVLSPAEAYRLLAAIDTGTLAGLRDLALVSVMFYSFARVSAVIAMRRQDYFRQERRGWLRLHEKGGTRHDVPAHHRAAEALDDYLELTGLDARAGGPPPEGAGPGVIRREQAAVWQSPYSRGSDRARRAGQPEARDPVDAGRRPEGAHPQTVHVDHDERSRPAGGRESPRPAVRSRRAESALGRGHDRVCHRLERHALSRRRPRPGGCPSSC